MFAGIYIVFMSGRFPHSVGSFSPGESVAAFVHGAIKVEASVKVGFLLKLK